MKDLSQGFTHKKSRSFPPLSKKSGCVFSHLSLVANNNNMFINYYNITINTIQYRSR